MQYPPQLTLDRIALFLNELQAAFWLERRALHASVYQCSEPCTYAQARGQAFTPVEAGFRWGPVWSTAWFHLEGDYPAEWAGSTVVALIDTGSEALVWSDAGPVQGLDANRKDLLLAAPAVGAGMVDLFVEAAANPGWRQEYSTEPAPFTFAGAWVARFTCGPGSCITTCRCSTTWRRICRRTPGSARSSSPRYSRRSIHSGAAAMTPYAAARACLSRGIRQTGYRLLRARKCHRAVAYRYRLALADSRNDP